MSRLRWNPRGTPTRTEGVQAELVSFTDPFCSWCWAAEPVLLRLRETYGDQLRFATVMGGLVPDAGPHFDPRRMAWLRAHLADVSDRTGQPIDVGMLDGFGAHFSTWPACIHVKAAELQGEAAGMAYLRRLRRAIMTERANPSDPEVAARLAGGLGLDVVAFRNAIADGSALQAFLEDRQACERHGVTGFPTLLLRSLDDVVQPGVLLVGHRPFDDIQEALERLVPGLHRLPPRSPADVIAAYGPLTTREVAQACMMDEDAARAALRGLEHDGAVVHRAVGVWAQA